MTATGYISDLEITLLGLNDFQLADISVKWSALDQAVSELDVTVLIDLATYAVRQSRDGDYFTDVSFFAERMPTLWAKNNLKVHTFNSEKGQHMLLDHNAILREGEKAAALIPLSSLSALRPSQDTDNAVESVAETGASLS
jgi:hypothetical protein